jgi:phosphatidylserine decarboxylase
LLLDWSVQTHQADDGLTRFRDRLTGEIVVEPVFGGNALNVLYETPLGRMITTHLLSRELPSRLFGYLQRSRLSRGKITNFVQEGGIDTSEAELALEAYRSLDEFFTRRLKPTVRPIDSDPERLVSPADGRAFVFPHLNEPQFKIKGSLVSLPELLADRALAQRYSGGSAIVIRLAPADYHRFHFPDDGVASESVPIGGRLHSVHPIALEAGAPSFRNKRQITHFESRGFGPMELVEIGALFVGTIVQTYRPGPVQRGQEKGFFRFGGSTVVILATEGRLQVDGDLTAASAEGIETLVRMGTGLARRQ